MIEIYRYGQYINKVSNQYELGLWIKNNVKPRTDSVFLIRPNISADVSFLNLKEIATRQNYTFKNVK